jgi:signal transduction histidine kinase
MLTSKDLIKEKEFLEKELLFSMAIHDLRNPLHCITSAIELKKLNAIPSEECLKVIENASDVIRHLVENILIISKIKMGILKLEKTTFNLEKLIDEIISLNKYSFKKVGLFLKKKIKSKNTFLSADRDLIARVINNLVSNSLKNTLKGGVVIVLDKVDNEIILKVKDDGIGIDENKTLRALYDFESGICIEDIGLGLIIAKKFIELHKGSFTVKKNKTKGTEAMIKFNF